jgi:hypothetical protein
VSLRHEGKAISAQMDGHVKPKGWQEVSDMRMWADAATGPDWGITPRL